MKASVTALALWMLAATVWAQELPREERVPGGVAIVALGASTGSRPAASFLAERVMIVTHENQWKAVVGIPLSIRPGRHRLQVREGERARDIDIAVLPKDYPAQHIRLRERRMVDLSAEDLARHHRDRMVISRAFAQWREGVEPALRFDRPAPGPLSSRFGLRRFFNDQPRAPHSGLDIAAPAGTPISAPADGVVVETGDFFFNGKTVFIEHGQGMISMFNHLDRIEVQAGQKLARGERVGTVGRTGRITGPHLHWTVVLNRSPVNPELFLAD
ncbi:MAG: peptidoglycan DD-metalloendopeptidase family protein [Pseudomonadota bacterium]